jgi:hypothetical protein
VRPPLAAWLLVLALDLDLDRGQCANATNSTMEDILSAQFDRVEKALSTLVDSIAAYNPSPQAAIDLVAADDELSHGLDQREEPWQRRSRWQTTDCTQSPGTRQTTPKSKLCAPKPKLSGNSLRAQSPP